MPDDFTLFNYLIIIHSGQSQCMSNYRKIFLLSMQILCCFFVDFLTSFMSIFVYYCIHGNQN